MTIEMDCGFQNWHKIWIFTEVIMQSFKNLAETASKNALALKITETSIKLNSVNLNQFINRPSGKVWKISLY